MVGAISVNLKNTVYSSTTFTLIWAMGRVSFTVNSDSPIILESDDPITQNNKKMY